jgi:hypothetical protein
VGLLTGLDDESEPPFGDGVPFGTPEAARDGDTLLPGDGIPLVDAPLAAWVLEGEGPPLLIAREAPAETTADTSVCFLYSLRRAIGLTLAAIGLSLVAVSAKMLESGLAASPRELARDESASPSRIDSDSSPVTLSFGERAAMPTLIPMLSIAADTCPPCETAASNDSSCDSLAALLFLRCGESHGSLQSHATC